MRHNYHGRMIDLFETIPFTTEQAKREALSVLRDNRRLNDSEYAYSPSTGAVGMRWPGMLLSPSDEIFRVFNTHYPMYKRNEEVTDWVSVGKGNRA